jgi:predicted type IV restriction endonuclease
MSRTLILHAVQTVILPMLLAMGYLRAEQPKTVKPTNTMRTYYVQADGKISARKPEAFVRTVRAQNITHARKVIG